MSIQLPPGWDGRVYRRPGNESTGLQAANFQLPEEDDDVGSVARRDMASDEVVIGIQVSDEWSPRWWPRGTLPIEIRRSDFAPYEGFEWRTAAIRHMIIDERAVYAFAAFGTADPPNQPLSEVNAILATLSISEGASAKE